MVLHAAGFCTSLCPRGVCDPTNRVARWPSQRLFSARSASCRAVGPEKLIIASLVLAFLVTRPLACMSSSETDFLASSYRILAACALLLSCPSSMAEEGRETLQQSFFDPFLRWPRCLCQPHKTSCPSAASIRLPVRCRSPCWLAPMNPRPRAGKQGWKNSQCLHLKSIVRNFAKFQCLRRILRVFFTTCSAKDFSSRSSEFNCDLNPRNLRISTLHQRFSHF